MSSGRCTNDSATQSAPSSRPNSRSRRSFAVSEDSGMIASGMLTPLRSESLPPTLTRVIAWPSLQRSTSRRSLPSSSKQLQAGLHDGEDLRMRQADALGAARRRIEIEAQRRARGEQHGAMREGADAQLGTLQIHQHADGPSRLGFDRADRFHPPPMIGVRAMAEIEAENVDPAMEQRRRSSRASSSPVPAWRRSWHSFGGACGSFAVGTRAPWPPTRFYGCWPISWLAMIPRPQWPTLAMRRSPGLKGSKPRDQR